MDIWQFNHSTLDVERSIQFHEPHGSVTKIPFRTARRIGRRLNRVCGWHGAMFAFEKGENGEKTEQEKVAILLGRDY